MYSVAPQAIKLADSLAGSEYGISELTLMKNAASACFNALYGKISSKDSIVILCGKGNNGGDGYELCRILKKEWFNVTCINVFDCEPSTQTAKAVYNNLLTEGVTILTSNEAPIAIKNASVIIDAIFGVGFYGSIEKNSTTAKLISLCNSNDNCLRVAIDAPSGINCLDGTVKGTAFSAHLTLTLAFYKTGTLSYPAREYCGKIQLLKIGFPKELEEKIPKHALIPDFEYIKSVLPKRPANTHKGNYGRLLMFCASEFMTGAGILAANAALRSGVGLLNIARDIHTLKILQHHLTEPVFSPIDTASESAENDLISLSQKATAILIGCGLGNCEHDKKAVFSLISTSQKPIILDADGINAVSQNIMVLKEAKEVAILTPHPLEFSRLTGKSVEEIQADRINLATSFSKQYGCVLILKGACTVIAGPEGELAVCTCGGAGLSKGGSGDVLAGLCSSLRAQGMSAFDSAVCSVFLHAKAADILSSEISSSGFLPSDLPLAIAKLLP
ncbi:MAG: NAD(P)H-hydrate dehydratase [Clostridia bacterium]|nr:NAD(P)H-hydrate dehydratase [Clostridia bacterium]